MRSMQLVNPSLFQHVTRHTDIFLSAGVLCIVFIMLLPMPPVIMDLLLVLNITFGLLILLMSLYVLKPMDFSSFPSILLLSTLFRL
ncbi:MAG: FHIPEP family type III secretion protein, partial [Flavobacteriales bacterium]